MLHETSRRTICRLLFVVLCLVPTAAVLATCVAQRWPGYANRHAAAWSQQFGLEVRIRAVRHLRPGATLYEGVRVANPESGQVLLSSRLVEVYDTGSEWVVAASQAELDATQAERLWRLIERRLRRELASDDRPWRFVAREVTWRHGEQAQTLVDVEAHAATTEAGDEAQISFRLAGTTMQQPAVLRVVRRRQGAVAQVGASVETGGAALPAYLLAPLVDARQWLGSRARFRGYLWLDETDDGWRGELAGSLSEVELERLVSARFPHVLAGTAEIEIERATVVGGRLEEATGALIAGPGQIGRSLIEAGAQHLGLGAARLPTANVVRYDRLGLAFAARSGQLVLEGRCTETPGAMLVAGGDVLWTQPVERQSVVGLVRTLVPYNEVQVPATRESDWLIGRLPIPSTISPDNQPPQVHLRLGNVRNDAEPAPQ